MEQNIKDIIEGNLMHEQYKKKFDEQNSKISGLEDQIKKLVKIYETKVSTYERIDQIELSMER